MIFMERITKEPWFNPRSKELSFFERERPITWQGWTVAIPYYIILTSVIIYNFYSVYTHTYGWTTVMTVILVLATWLTWRIIIDLSSDEPDEPG